MWQQLRRVQRSKTARYGVPMLLVPELAARVNIEKQSVILEEEYEKMKKVDLDNWKNIRGPRPWENSKEFQDQQREQISKRQRGD
uniref:Cytochrome c oxidase assembly protein COX16 homolog, mitochondrial n=1 Tax=Astyanax mexicanus TaxID=7994 RepID=A0A8B9KCC7_ASTMX